MQQYQLALTGLNPLLMHRDNIAFAEKIEAWRKDPANKELSVRGDDRSPAWTWLSYVYHDTRHFGIDADNLMTMLREGGAKVTAKGKETYKKQTQSGIMLDQQQFDLLVNGKQVPVAPFQALIGETNFLKHLEAAEAAGFELSVKRAKVGQAKHVRVRPMFRDWTATGSFTVLDEELSGLTEPILKTILAQAGALCGLGDWRPSSPKSSGTFGTFQAELIRV
jgi:hypothetical protein